MFYKAILIRARGTTAHRTFCSCLAPRSTRYLCTPALNLHPTNLGPGCLGEPTGL